MGSDPAHQLSLRALALNPQPPLRKLTWPEKKKKKRKKKKKAQAQGPHHFLLRTKCGGRGIARCGEKPMLTKAG